MKPDPKLIDSMALRYRHDFGFLDEQTQNSIRTTMTQLWEEVVGIGFYKGKTLYTEEQVREAIDIARKGTVTDAYGDLEVLYSFEKEEIIQSLKQPKKD